MSRCPLQWPVVFLKINRMKKRFTLIVFLVSQTLLAQLRPYTQYHLAPTLTNPALVGTSDYLQVTAQYRQSNVSAYQIPSLSFIYPFFKKETGNRYGGMGFTLINQSSGPSGMYQVTGALGGFGYDLTLNERHHLATGLQLGYINKRIDMGKVTTDSQFGSSGFDADLATGEEFERTSTGNLTINTGATWYYTDAIGSTKASLGLSFYNLNRPAYSFLKDRSREPVDYLVHGSLRAAQWGKVSVVPSFRYLHQGKKPLATLGSLFEYRVNRAGESKLGAGLWLHTNHSAGVSLQYEQAQYLIAFGYDFSTFSEPSIPSLNNAFEVALSWRMNRKQRLTSRKQATESPVTEEPQLAQQKPEEKDDAHVTPKTEIAKESAVVNKGAAQPITKEEKQLLAQKIAYPLGDTEPSPEAEPLLDSLAQVLKQHPDWKLEIIGHSCSLGSPKTKEQVSRLRAENIKHQLLRKGVAEQQLVAIGQSDRYPIASNQTEAGRIQNRRVEFRLLKLH